MFSGLPSITIGSEGDRIGRHREVATDMRTARRGGYSLRRNRSAGGGTQTLQQIGPGCLTRLDHHIDALSGAHDIRSTGCEGHQVQHVDAVVLKNVERYDLAARQVESLPNLH